MLDNKLKLLATIKRVWLFIIFLCSSACTDLLAQDIFTTPGTIFNITASQTFHVNGLTLVPSVAFDLNGLSITKTAAITNTAPGGATTINRAYIWSANSPAFSGTLQLNYLDGSELNGLSEVDLEVNNYNGNVWTQVASATNDATLNFVLTQVLTGVALREITLASSSAPLPVTWLDFTATAQGTAVLLNWSTAQELNSLDFVVQHSLDGERFTDVTTLSAAGSSTAISFYHSVHAYPVLGYNYYRIHQRDFNGESTDSEIRSVKFSNSLNTNAIQIIGNPIQTQELKLMTPIDQDVTLYTLTGKLCWNKHLEAGSHNIDVSLLPKGSYLLQTISSSYKIIKL